MGSFYEIDALLRGALQADETSASALQEFEAQLVQKLDSLHQLDVELGADSTYMDSLLGQRRALLDGVTSIDSLARLSLNPLLESRSLAIENAWYVNHTIQADSIYELNERDFNNLFIESITVGLDSMPENKLLALWNLANQCPLAGGDAVFKARSLYSLIDPLISYDDGQLCNPGHQPLRRASDKTPLGFSLYPNPAKGIVVAQFSRSLAYPSTLALYDAQGQMRLQKPIPAGEQSAFLDTSGLPAGLYYCVLKGVDTTQKAERLVIIR